MSSHKLRSAVSVDFSVMIFILFAHIFLLPSLELDSQNSAQCSAVELYICFSQLLAEGSVMTIRVATHLITGEDWLRCPLHYC